MEDPNDSTSVSIGLVTVVLLGKSGSDKASVGNSVLGNECFGPETSTCKRGVQRVNDEMCCIINTPSLYHGPQLDSEEQGLEELMPSFPDARVFLLVLQDDHVSPEEIEMFAKLKKTYGDKVVNHIIVVLVGQDRIPNADLNIQRIIEECSERVCYFKPDMDRDDLNFQLLREYNGMKQKCGSERVYETLSRLKKLSHKKPEEENERLTDEEHVAAIPEENVHLESAEEKSVVDVPDSRRNSMTIVLLGQSGSGKSATGNTILAKRCFESRASSTAITQECGSAEELVCGINTSVVDTPDFFSEDLKNPGFHIQRCRELSQAEPVVYLLVMHMGRFTDGEREIISNIRKTFGEKVFQKMIILFTGKEKLKGGRLEDYVINTDPQLKQLIKETGSRCHAFNNNDQSRHQVKELVKMIVEMLFNDGIDFKEHFIEHGYKRLEHKDCTFL